MANGTAHGYVVLMVRCANPVELANVTERLTRPFHGIDGKGYSDGKLTEWYGGRFDYLGCVYGEPSVAAYDARQRFVSKGDNRFVGVFEASEVLTNEDQVSS